MAGDPWNAGWNEGWNEGWNVGWNARRTGGQPIARPAPTPTPTIFQQAGQADPWNQGWNTGWNTGWNVGWNAYQPQGQVAGAQTENRVTFGDLLKQPAPKQNPPIGRSRQSSNVDLSNPVKQTDYARGLGFNSWQEYLNSLNTGGGGGSSGPSAEEILNSSYQDYYNQLDATLPWLESQRTSQEAVAKSSYDTGLANLQTQLASGQAQNEQYQARSLRDLAANVRAGFVSGNTLLGAAGAGDSSAANQYSYALTRLGNQQRGAIRQEVQNRTNQLQDSYNTAVRDLKTQYDTQIASIAAWFGQQQQSLREMKASAALQKSQQALNIALQAIQTAKTEAANRRSVLEQWVVNNSTNIKQLASNWQALTGATLATPSTLDISPRVPTTTSPFVSQTLPGEKKRVSLWENVVPGYSNFA
jgi:hypothetical protein